MGDVDLERFRLSGSLLPVRKSSLVTNAKPQAVKAFLRGPIPWGWLIRAGNIPRRNALIVGVVLWHLAGLRSERVGLVLCVNRCKPFGLGRKAVERGLRDLEAAGLVSVVRASGRCARVDLID